MERQAVTMLFMAVMAGVTVPTVHAKRPDPKPVKPVVYNGVRYTAPNDRGRVCYVQARDVQTGTLKWERIIYEVPIDPKIEEDVQWDFIAALSIQDGSLLVRTESIQTYVLELKTKGVTKKPKPAHPTGKHIVQAGESLSTIALTHRVSVKDLAARNNIQDPDKIVAGQELILPEQETRQNQALFTTSEPAAGADSSSHQR